MRRLPLHLVLGPVCTRPEKLRRTSRGKDELEVEWDEDDEQSARYHCGCHGGAEEPSWVFCHVGLLSAEICSLKWCMPAVLGPHNLRLEASQDIDPTEAEWQSLELYASAEAGNVGQLEVKPLPARLWRLSFLQPGCFGVCVWFESSHPTLLCSPTLAPAPELQEVLALAQGTNRSLQVQALWTLGERWDGKRETMDEDTRATAIRAADAELLGELCRCFSFLSDGPNDHIQGVLDQHVEHRLVQLLQYPSRVVQRFALATVGNLVTGDDDQTQRVVDAGCLGALRQLLGVQKSVEFQKNVVWVVSNITAGNARQVKAVLDEGLVAPLVELCESADPKVQKEVAWAFSNATSSCSDAQQVAALVKCGVVRPMVELLPGTDTQMRHVLLEFLDNLSSNHDMDFKGEVSEAGGPDRLYSIAHQEDRYEYNEVELAARLLDKHFPDWEPTTMVVTVSIEGTSVVCTRMSGVEVTRLCLDAGATTLRAVRRAVAIACKCAPASVKLVTQDAQVLGPPDEQSVQAALELAEAPAS